MFTLKHVYLFLAIAVSATWAVPLNAQSLTGKSPASDEVESPPIFRVEEVVSAKFIQGPEYFIAADVPVRDNKYLFNIRTVYGDMPVLSRNMLELRLREMHSVELARQLVGDPQLVNGITQTLKQTPEGVKVFFGDPGGALMRAPQGLKRMASNMFDAQNRRAGNEERRKFAVQIGCDPETTNPVLIALLDNIALRKSIGKGGSNLGMNIVLPGLGLLSTTKNFKDELIRRSPSEINDSIEKELLSSGVWEPVAKQFCRERSYTTLQRMVVMDQFRALRGVENQQYLIYRATTAYNEVEGLAIIREMKLMRELHESYGVSRIDLQGLPVAMLKDNRFVIVNASDYIYDSQELRDAIGTFRRARPNDSTTFVTAGRVSDRAKNTFAKHQIQVQESGKTQLAERNSEEQSRR